MNLLPVLPKLISCLLFVISAVTVFAQAPTHRKKFTPVIHDTVNGFYEYLPRNYATDVHTKYPLLIFLHGGGECGSIPNDTTLEKLTAWGPPALIKKAAFPDSFFVAGQWYKFIVISPQIKVGAWTMPGDNTAPAAVDAIIEYAKAAYRVDHNRIYLCGLSMGGGAIWRFAGSSTAAASKLAAVVVACGASDLSTTNANNIAVSDLPVLATHNKGDTVVSYLKTTDNAFRINAYIPAISPAARVITWDAGDHNVWARTFDDIHPGVTSMGLTGNVTDTLGVNAYQWLLQFTRIGVALPLTWQSFTVKETNGDALLHWATVQNENNASYSVEKSSDGSRWSVLATLPVLRSSSNAQLYLYKDSVADQYACYYRIRQTDLDGKYSYSVIQKFTPFVKNSILKIFPNPFSHQVSIQYAGIQQKNITLKLLNAAGHVVVSEQYAINSNSDILTLSKTNNLIKGIYFALIEDQSGSILLRKQLLKE